MKKNAFIVIIFLIIVTVTISYSVYLYYFQNNDFVDWLNTLISTIISILLALLIAIYIFYYQTNIIQKETKNRFIPLIEEELIGIWTGLLDTTKYSMKFKFSDKEIVYFYLDEYDDIIFEEAICSNVFNQEETRFLLEIKIKIRFVNIVNDHLINLRIRRDEDLKYYKRSLEFLYTNHNKSRKELKSAVLLANKYFKFNKLDKKIGKDSSNAR